MINIRRYWQRTWPLHVLLLPAVVFAIVFRYVPILGIVISFMDYKPWLGILGSPWVGWDNFRMIFSFPDSTQVIINTLIISGLKFVFGVSIPFVFAILLNEVKNMAGKRLIQTIVYLPHFLSWVILGGILIDILSINGGIVNKVIAALGFEPIMFLGDNRWFRFTLVVSDVWKDFGFSAIVYLAALAGIDPAQYEAAEMDGARWWQQMIYITVPGLLPMLAVVATLALGRIMDAGFDQVLMLYNPLVYETGDIIDTFVYRQGIQGGAFSFATAVGVFKSLVSFAMVFATYQLLYRFSSYRIF